jgi:hypothetical protein
MQCVMENLSLGRAVRFLSARENHKHITRITIVRSMWFGSVLNITGKHMKQFRFN